MSRYEDDSDSCVLCGGILVYLGTLGRLLWLRCRDCGMEQNQEANCD